MSDWKQLSSKLVFDKYRKIEEKIYQLPDGKLSDFYINADQSSAHVLALTPDGKIICVKQFRPGPGKMLHELPGGYIDPGETPEQAAAREMLEETGYTGDIKFVTKYYHDAYATVVRHCFVATNCVLSGQQSLDSDEFLEVELLDVSDFIDIVKNGETTTTGVSLLCLDYLDLLK